MDMNVRKENVSVFKVVLLICYVTFYIFFDASFALATSEQLAVPLPRYSDGTTYVYSNMTWETVKKSEKDEVVWENYNGQISKRSPDFTLGRTSWSNKKHEGERVYNRLKGKDITELWPLKPGNRARYIEKIIWRFPDRRKKKYRYRWNFKVIGPKRIAIKAGMFDTLQIEGKRYFIPFDNNQHSNRLTEVINWYYSEKIGHWLLKTKKKKGEIKERRYELLAVIPPYSLFEKTAKSAIEINFQEGLEKSPKNKPLLFHLTAQKVKGSITPVNTFRSSKKRFYRSYLQEISINGVKKTYFGVAYRNSKGLWIVPRR